MHPDLSSHLHTDECNEMIKQLSQCHVDNKYKKFLGACNDFKRAMDRCLKNERETNRRENLRKAREKQAVTKQNILKERQSSSSK
ncbi:PREDICTED: COX assembly mitochondrial protein 2 homolog [Priapulus caudatus]|uniref:COX assembly mitochondrial protein n=1 Tax=Priapulus caudatus TaxID=37621 RepID=A0ABM1F4T6_PRICU|nr:PREDICTED: COX assembly mitochondrial protein 2 homolog [Priapulus caudatus]